MKAYRSGDGRIHIREAATQGRQADMVISLINDYIKNGGELNDIAVLYRVKKEASVLVSSLETIGMPFLQEIWWMISILVCVIKICLRTTGYQEEYRRAATCSA